MKFVLDRVCREDAHSIAFQRSGCNICVYCTISSLSAFTCPFGKDISMGESNTVVSAYTMYRHLQQYCIAFLIEE